MCLKVALEGREYKCFLYNQEDVPVAYLSCIPENGAFELCDIEVREEHFGAPLTHTGSYTPLGLERVAKYFHTPAELQVLRATYRLLGFVDDWECTI